MQSTAVITDIHGNLPALEAALARIEELGIDDVYCGGDLVGHGPPNEVCALIEERGTPTICLRRADCRGRSGLPRDREELRGRAAPRRRTPAPAFSALRLARGGGTRGRHGQKLRREGPART